MKGNNAVRLADIIKDAKEWSSVTFGPGTREKGVIAHIRKELEEIENAPTPELKAREWVDVIILGIDGLWRSRPNMPIGALVAMIVAKYAKNRQRQWPDWRTLGEDQPIEHKRGIHD